MTETTEAPKPIRKPPTKQPLPLHVEARLAQVREVRAPGARLGILAVRLDTIARDAQEALDRVGDAVVANIMGRDHAIPIRAEIGITLRLSLGNGDVQEFPVTLRRGEPITEDSYLECCRCDAIVLGRAGEDLNDLMDRVAYGEGQEPSGPKPWWTIDSDAGGAAYCPDHNHANDEECNRNHRHDENGCTETELGCGPDACGWSAARLAEDPDSHDAGAPLDGRCFAHGLSECPPDCGGPNRIEAPPKAP